MVLRYGKYFLMEKVGVLFIFELLSGDDIAVGCKLFDISCCAAKVSRRVSSGKFYFVCAFALNC